jgi:hypothetical protein
LVLGLPRRHAGLVRRHEAVRHRSGGGRDGILRYLEKKFVLLDEEHEGAGPWLPRDGLSGELIVDQGSGDAGVVGKVTPPTCRP